MAIQRKERRILLRTRLSSIPRLIQPYHVCERVNDTANASINGNKPCTLVEWWVMIAIHLGVVNTA